MLPGESQGRGSLAGCRLWGRTESHTTEATEHACTQDASVGPTTTQLSLFSATNCPSSAELMHLVSYLPLMLEEAFKLEERGCEEGKSTRGSQGV